MSKDPKPVTNVTPIPVFSEPSVTYSVDEQRKYWQKWARRELIGKVVQHPILGEVKFTSTGICILFYCEELKKITRAYDEG